MIRTLTYWLLTAVTMMATALLFQNVQADRQVMADRMELTHVKYGLFNVDEWKALMAGVITQKLNEFELTTENRSVLKKKVENVLENVLEEVETVLEGQNKSRGLKGFLRGVAMDAFDVMNDVKSGIPAYADRILDFLDDPENREQIRQYLIVKFNEFASKTAGEVDKTQFNRILAHYGAGDIDACLFAMEHIQSESESKRISLWILLLTSFSALSILLFFNRTGVSAILPYVLSCCCLLLAGITLPMIDIEASITTFNFTLVGEPIEFTDQVLFFQSKSILEVVQLLTSKGEIPLLLVGSLVFSFSVLIPFSKLVLSAMLLLKKQEPRTGLGRFLVFRSSKWSMADVMVVAIFMSYIGFNGVINSELTQLEELSSNVQVFTTNNSTLMPGFYLFLLYCLGGLIISDRMSARPKSE